MKSYRIKVEFSGTRTYLVKGKDEEDAKKRLIAGTTRASKMILSQTLTRADILSVEDVDE